MYRQFTREEVAARTNKENLAIIIDNVVYDVSSFLEDHPGGIEVLLANAGRDASQCFSDIGHSDEAKLLRSTFMIGEIVEDQRQEPVKPRNLPPPPTQENAGESLYSLLNAWAPPLFLATLATVFYWYLFS